MFSGGNRFQSPIFEAQDQSLKLRPYNSALLAFTTKVCTEVGLPGSDVCMFETRLAFDCVLRHRVQKMGALTDNLGQCQHHINSMKQNITKESDAAYNTKNSEGDSISKTLDNYLNEINYMRKSFV